MKSLIFLFRIRTVEKFLEFYLNKLKNDKMPEYLQIEKTKEAIDIDIRFTDILYSPETKELIRITRYKNGKMYFQIHVDLKENQFHAWENCFHYSYKKSKPTRKAKQLFNKIKKQAKEKINNKRR